MFSSPLSLIAGGQLIERTISTDTLIGNLWTFLGSLEGVRDVTLIIDNADAGDIQVTLDWTAGSTFTIICINGGRILGLGGAGGRGGDDFGATGEAGLDAINGTPVLDIKPAG